MPARNTLLLALAFSAGYIDTLSYLGLGRVLTANMTGNTVLLGIALAGFDAQAALRSGLALGGFLGGAALAAWIVQRDATDHLWPSAVTHALMLETVMLALLALGWALAGESRSALATGMLIAISALAMGAQSAAVHRLEVSGITTTYITGTLTNLVSRLMGRGRRKVRRGREGTRLLAAVWTVYLVGAAIAAVSLSHDATLALALPPVLIAVVAGTAALRFRRA